MRGYFLMRRGWMDDEDFEDEPYSAREAWFWLIENAAYRPIKVRLANGKFVELKAGQLLVSVRDLGRKWLRSIGWVQRRFRVFQNSEKIESVNESGLTLITIRDYAVFQNRVRSGESPIDSPSVEKPRIGGTPIKKNQGETKESISDLKSERGLVGRSAPDVRLPTDEEKAEVAALAERAKAALAGEVPKGIRDAAAYKAAVGGAKFRNARKLVNDAARLLDDTSREEAWEAVAAAQQAGSWGAIPVDKRRRLRELYRWAKSLGPEQLKELAAKSTVLVAMAPPPPVPSSRLSIDASPSELVAALEAKIAREKAA